MSITENELLRLLVEENRFTPLDDTKHVTRKMLSDKMGVSDHKATSILEGCVASGKLERFKARTSTGQVVIAYREIEAKRGGKEDKTDIV